MWIGEEMKGSGQILKYEKRNSAIISELEGRIVEARNRLVEIQYAYDESLNNLANHCNDEINRLVKENARLTELAAQKASRADELFEALKESLEWLGQSTSSEYQHELDKLTSVLLKDKQESE